MPLILFHSLNQILWKTLQLSVLCQRRLKRWSISLKHFFFCTILIRRWCTNKYSIKQWLHLTEVYPNDIYLLVSVLQYIVVFYYCYLLLSMLSRLFCAVCVQVHRHIYSHSPILNCLFTCFPLKATYSFTSLMKWLSSLMVGINKILNLNM